MSHDTREWIVDWFLEHTAMVREDLPAGLERSYFEAGWLDSLAFVDFVADVEAKFGVQFTNDQFLDREFSTIAGLARILDGARAPSDRDQGT